jgi:putative endopeptidase
MLPASDYQALPGSPPVALFSGADDLRSRHSPWRRYASVLFAAVGLVAAIVIIAQVAGPRQADFWVETDEVSAVGEHLGLQTQLPDEVVAAMNFSTHPCDNFYEFVCGNWVKNAAIPNSRGSWSKSWDGAGEIVHQEMISLYTDEWPEGSPYGRLHDWYSSCMDLPQINELGAQPLQPMLQRIEALETLADLQDLLVDLVLWDLPHFMNMDVSVGVRAPGEHLLFVSAGGITLPDPGYYDVLYNGTHDDDKREDREHIWKYFKQINVLAGSTEDYAALVANQTIEAETVLAQWQVDEPYDDDDLEKVKMGPPLSNLTALIDLCPNIPWRRIFTAIADGCKEYGWECNKKLLDDENVIVMGSPYFYTKLNDALGGNISIAFWKPLLRSHYIYNLAPLLNEEFLQANLDLDTYMSGVTELPKREKKCVRAATNGLSALSDLAFKDRYFDKRAQADGWNLLNHMKAAFIKNLKSVDWMDEATHAAALRKAEKMGLNLGGPKVYKQLVYPVTNDNYFANSGFAYHCKLLRMFMELGEKIDERVWNMRASTVNAYYDNGLNALFIPAGIMQKPFFSHDFPMEQNFGGIGAIMGHEMTHGFDNTGAKFDENSKMSDWWSKNVTKEFKRRTKCIKTLYSGFEIAETSVLGQQTLGENIADFGGLKIAYKAYLSLYNDTIGGEAPLLSKKLFFIAYGQNWYGNVAGEKC